MPTGRKVQRTADLVLYKKRNVVERYFCTLKHFRRVATRFDKVARHFLAEVMLASAPIWLRNWELAA
ncbi:hypothetical protein A6U87_19240 [Rhizobium sp. AC44/96]|nr:hypothetical protein A6U87_19240 [Rhizobium sp. AC44/96]